MDKPKSPRMVRLYRHTLAVRITHWINVLVLTVMVGSGLQIFIAHPALYWGNGSAPARAWLVMDAQTGPSGERRGITRLGGHSFDTTGWFGLSRGPAHRQVERGFPSWATLPGPRWLAMGRRWHFFFAWLLVVNGLAYVTFAIAQGHLRRDLLPNRHELADIPGSIRRHLSLRSLRADAAGRYNVLQKLSYLVVVFVLGPLIVVTGLTLSPRLDSGFPWLVDLLGGRQSARSIHFLVAFSFLLFVAIHLTMVVLIGPIRSVRSMITGRAPAANSESTK